MAGYLVRWQRGDRRNTTRPNKESKSKDNPLSLNKKRMQFVSRETFTMYGVLIQLSLIKSYFCASFLALVTESNLHIYKYKDLGRR